ncbi:MAG: peptidoglycan bridge formation glycyltransferase FemA/FemB family protein [Candidatus Magasanikbacteria bacterium]|nr:peptidoglycan bridge formation glycyltransferase FemA/FemB family protein [Candidatus Magasanikbacteria bacterium]
MELKLINSAEQWNNIFFENKMEVSFLQSFAWGEILKSEEKMVERLIIEDENKTPILVAQIILTKILGKKYAFCPGGPILKLTINKEQLTNAYLILLEYFRKNKIIFFRIEPGELLIANCSLLIKKTIDITPRATTLLDLKKSEAVLLEAMHEKARYNIRLAEKKDLRLAVGKDAKVFLELITETAGRDNFSLHDTAHYQAILNSPLSRQLTLFTSEGAPAATGIWVGYGQTFTYLFGASRYKLRNLMAPHLIQWEAIKLGKKLGYNYYDFFGITPPSATNPNQHPYAGVTRFKINFGGYTAEKPGTFDLIISPLQYRIYEALRAVRRLV